MKKFFILIVLLFIIYIFAYSKDVYFIGGEKDLNKGLDYLIINDIKPYSNIARLIRNINSQEKFYNYSDQSLAFCNDETLSYFSNITLKEFLNNPFSKIKIPNLNVLDCKDFEDNNYLAYKKTENNKILAFFHISSSEKRISYINKLFNEDRLDLLSELYIEIYLRLGHLGVDHQDYERGYYWKKEIAIKESIFFLEKISNFMEDLYEKNKNKRLLSLDNLINYFKSYRLNGKDWVNDKGRFPFILINENFKRTNILVKIIETLPVFSADLQVSDEAFLNVLLLYLKIDYLFPKKATRILTYSGSSPEGYLSLRWIRKQLFKRFKDIKDPQISQEYNDFFEKYFSFILVTHHCLIENKIDLKKEQKIRTDIKKYVNPINKRVLKEMKNNITDNIYYKSQYIPKTHEELASVISGGHIANINDNYVAYAIPLKDIEVDFLEDIKHLIIIFSKENNKWKLKKIYVSKCNIYVDL